MQTSLPSAGTAKKVLVIEDERNMRIFLANLLRGGGFIPVEACGPAEGLSKARDEKPVLIIMDAMLPAEGGRQLFAQLKSDLQLQRVPVILLSTIAEKTICHWTQCQHPASRPEPDAYLAKPPEAEELLEMVRRLSRAPETEQSS